MTVLTYYFTLDSDDLFLKSFDSAQEALALAKRNPAGDSFTRAAFSVTYDTDTHEWGTVKRLEEPTPAYHARVRDGDKPVFRLDDLGALFNDDITDIFREDESGNLIKVDEKEKNRAVARWKARRSS